MTSPSPIVLGRKISLEDARKALTQAEAFLRQAGRFALANKASYMRGEVDQELARAQREMRP